MYMRILRNRQLYYGIASKVTPRLLRAQQQTQYYIIIFIIHKFFILKNKKYSRMLQKRSGLDIVIIMQVGLCCGSSIFSNSSLR